MILNKVKFRGVWIALGAAIIAVGLLGLQEADETRAGPKLPNPSPIIRVRTAEATQGVIRRWIWADGIVRAARREPLSFESAGRVVYLNKDSRGLEIREGSAVMGPSRGESRGELLARVDDRAYVEAVKRCEAELAQARSEVAVAKAELLQAESTFELNQSNLKRAQSLHQKKLSALSAVDEARSQFATSNASLAAAEARLESARSRVLEVTARLNQAKIELERTRIFAPFDGVIAHLNIRVGDTVGKTTPDPALNGRSQERAPIVLIDPSWFEVSLDLPPQAGVLVKEGQQAWVYAQSAASIETSSSAGFFRGSVHSVSPAVSLSTRMNRVRVRLVEGADTLRDGEFVTVKIAVDEKPDALLIPTKALLFNGAQAYAFVADRQTAVVERRTVTLGLQAIDKAEILDGLEAGERVVTQGRHLLQSGLKVDVLAAKENG